MSQTFNLGAHDTVCYTRFLFPNPPLPAVQEWVDFVQKAGVERVVSMLSPSELETYAEPLPAALEAAFGAGNYVNVDAKAEGE